MTNPATRIQNQGEDGDGSAAELFNAAIIVLTGLLTMLTVATVA
jgi:hypothetical protein